jgi:serine/threonine protein kinase
VQLEFLGGGAFGKVYKVCDKRSIRYYALKEVETGQDETIEDLIIEIEMMQGVSKIDCVRLAKVKSFGVVEAKNTSKEKNEILQDLGECSLQDLIKSREDLKRDWKDEEILFIIRETLED